MSMMGLIGDAIVVTGTTGVQVDQVGTAVLSPSGTSYNYTGLNVSSNSNRAVVICVAAADLGAASSMTATWNGVSMTLIGGVPFGGSGGSLGQQIFFFVLQGAAVGSGLTCHLAWTNTAQLNIGGISLYNVNPTSVPAGFPNSNSAFANGITASVTVTSAVNHLVLCGMSTDQGLTANSGTLWPIYAGGAPVFGARGSYTPGAASVTPTGTNNATANWLSAALDVSP